MQVKMQYSQTAKLNYKNKTILLCIERRVTKMFYGSYFQMLAFESQSHGELNK